MLKIELIVNSLFNSNTYILYFDECTDAWLVDCGDYCKVKEWLNESQRTLKGIFVTHGHFDHIYEINDILANHPNLPIYLSKNQGVEILGNPKLNASKYTETPLSVQNANFIKLGNGDTVELVKGKYIKALDTIGHSVDSISYSIDNYLFTGDAFIPNIRTVSKIKGGDREIAKATTLMIYEMCSEDTFICPGHETMVNKSDVYIERMV